MRMLIRRLNRDYNPEIPDGMTVIVTQPLLGFAVFEILAWEFGLELRPALILMAAVFFVTIVMQPLSHRAKDIYWRDDRSQFQDLLLGCKLILALLLMLWLFTVWGPMGQELFG
jgi:hypothetical protein